MSHAHEQPPFSPEMLAEIIPLATNEHPADEGVFLTEEVRGISGPETKLYHGTARVQGAIARYTYEEPREIEDPVPALFVNGYGGVKSVYRELRHETALQGKPAVTLKQIRALPLPQRLQWRHYRHPELLPSMAVGSVMKAVAEEHGTETFDLAGHSMGGFIAANVAEHMPKKVRFLSLMASAGMEKHNLNIMRERAGRFLVKELLPNLNKLRTLPAKSVLKQEFEYIMRSPTRTLLEGIAVANCDIREKVKHLGKSGIKTAALQFQADELFPLDEVVYHSIDIVDIFDVYEDETAGHLTPLLQPKGVARSLMNIVERQRKTGYRAAV